MSLLGIDVGTTGVRATVFDETGRVLADASSPCPYTPAGPGRAEASAEGWWNEVRVVCARVGTQTELARVAGVGVTGQAPTAVLVDGDGRELRPAILWLDVRADREARSIETRLGTAQAWTLGGNRMHAYFLGPKLAWLRAHEPENLDRAALVLQSHAFVAFRLTGEASCDRSTAMLCAPLFDASKGVWSDAGAHAVGIETRVLPRITRAHEVVGHVTRAAASATGLREGTPVVAGGGDFAASALGAGVVEEGEACLMLGTAGNLLLPTREPRFDPRLINSHHVGCDRWLLLGGTLCGAALEWFRSTCAVEATWETLEREAATIGPGAGGIIALPYFQGERTPIWDEHARGAFVGLDLTHTRAHLYRAILEGVALGFRHSLAVAEEAGLRLEEAVAANGAGKSALLRQTLADALGVPVTWTPDGGAPTVKGAAILAGLGVGLMRDVEQARGLGWNARESCVRHEPNPEVHAALQEVFARRIALWDALHPLSKVD